MSMPLLATDRLLIRPFEATDLDAIFQILDVELGEGAGDAAQIVQARAALIRFTFTELNLQRIVAMTTYDNVASIGVMRKLGMTIERNPLPEPAWMQVVGVLEQSQVAGSGVTPGS